MGNEPLLILANLLVCSGAGWLCICRMTKMSHRTTKLLMRWQYVIWFTVLAASGWSFLFGAQANLPQLSMGIAILGYLIVGIPAWKHGAPPYAKRETV